jgi:hypothetical protein
MDTGTLIQVVEILDAEIKSDRAYLASDSAESLSFEEDFAMTSTIHTLERLAEQFRGIIEANIADMEARAQGE